MEAVRRNTELGLLLLAIGVTIGGYALAGLGDGASIPADIFPFLGVVVALFVGAHIATRILAPAADGVLLPIAALLNGIGYVFIARLASSSRVPDDLPGLQATWTAIGVGAYVLTLLFVRRLRTFERYRYTIALIGIVLLMVPLVPGIGREINGARIWASIGPINFQPGEFAKLALAVFLAAYLTEKRELLATGTRRIGPVYLPEAKHFAPLLLAWGFSLLVMVAQKDLGSSLLFLMLFVVVLWVGTERIAYLVVGLLLFAVGAVFAWSRFGHVQERVDAWLDPWADRADSGYQIIEATFAFSAGGLTGTGIGLGDPDRVPEIETDFIFAAIGEELGLLGTTAILIAYLFLIGSGLRIAMRARNPFQKLLATGLTALVGLQAFIIIGGVTRLVPLTGITLPFVSYGGSSLLSNYILIALLVRLSDETALDLEAAAPAAQQVRA